MRAETRQNDTADLYTLSFDDLNGLAFRIFSEKKGDFIERTLREKSAANIVDSIEKSKERPFENLLFGLGIRYVGATVASKLAMHFENIDAHLFEISHDVMPNHEIRAKFPFTPPGFRRESRGLRIIFFPRNGHWC